MLLNAAEAQQKVKLVNLENVERSCTCGSASSRFNFYYTLAYTYVLNLLVSPGILLTGNANMNPVPHGGSRVSLLCVLRTFDSKACSELRPKNLRSR